jgi:hypothetical protein
MPSAVIVCPSGLTGEIRTAKIGDLEKFAETARRNFARALTDLLNSCWLRTDDKAIYEEPLHWGKALAGDRLYAWIQMWILRSGADLDFQFQCDNEGCRTVNPKLQGWTSKLDALPVQMLPEASKATFLAGNRFETTVDGKRVVFRLMTGELEAEVEGRSRGKNRTLSEGMAERLVEVEGVGNKFEFLAAWAHELDDGEVERFIAVRDAADCGVELGVEVQCEFCSRVVPIDIPFAATWLRLAKKKTSTSRGR